ncbi:hypothetical protein SALBM217S_08393 [Streptomyces griseoloalbus]
MALIAVFVGYNTAKEFGGTPILGGAVASIIVYAKVADVEAFGQHFSPGQGGVLGALAAACLGVYVEKRCRRWVPSPSTSWSRPPSPCWSPASRPCSG